MNWLDLPRDVRQDIYDRAVRKMYDGNTVSIAECPPDTLSPLEWMALWHGVDEPKVDYSKLTAEQVRQLKRI